MDDSTVKALCALDNEFYRRNHASFSETRQQPWDGWERMLAALGHVPGSALDVACGNMRLRAFLDRAYGADAPEYYGIDACPDLVPDAMRNAFFFADVLEALLEGCIDDALDGRAREIADPAPGQMPNVPPCDLVACFGFMHHVPTSALRKRLMGALLRKTAPGGVLAVSFWQFARDEKTLEKALASTEAATRDLGLQLDEGDYILGWKDVRDAHRYCHSFSDAEIDELIASCAHGAVLCDRYQADGKGGQANAYVLLRARE